jgi:hypothetical protein
VTVGFFRCICPNCNGRQYVIVAAPSGSVGRIAREDCWLCKGEGEIDWPPPEDEGEASCPTPTPTLSRKS